LTTTWQSAEGVDRGLDDAVAEVGLGDVAVAGHRLAAQLLDLGHGLLGRRVVDVVDHHLGAVAHQAQRDLPADPRPEPVTIATLPSI
jgi:hypothetical protein